MGTQTVEALAERAMPAFREALRKEKEGSASALSAPTRETVSGMLSDLSCRIEQIGAVVALHSDELQEIADSPSMPKHLSDRLYSQWLLLLVVGRDLEALKALSNQTEEAEIREHRERQ